MNKQELIDAVAAQAGISKSATAETIDAVLAAVSKTVAAGDSVQLIGFGTFASWLSRGPLRTQSEDRRND